MSQEISENHKLFEIQQKKLLDDSFEKLSEHEDVFLESYTRLTTLQGWKEYVLVGGFSEHSMSFYIEAQNDALASHLLARQGMWRSSLQSLRSCLENILVALYYSEHPVELRLWSEGKYKTGFSQLMSYFESHPDFINVDEIEITGLTILKHEYGELSKAVHGSSKSFMMSKSGHVPSLWIPEEKELGQWATRQKHTLEGLNLLLITFNREKIKGTAHTFLRESLGNVISKARAKKIKSAFGVYV